MDQADQAATLVSEDGSERAHSLFDRITGILSAIAEAALHPIFIVPVVVAAAAGSSTSIGALAAVVTAAWLLPQLVTDPSLWRGPLARLPSILYGLRAGVAVLIAGAALATGSSGSALLGLLLILLTIFWALGGILATGQPEGLLADRRVEGALPPERLLVWSSAAAVLVGLLVARQLGPDGTGFPQWVSLLAFLAAIVLAVAAGLAWRRSPWAAEPEPAAWTTLLLVPALIGHTTRLRRYLFFRVVMTVSSLADPFYLVYALRAFDVPWQSVGIYLGLGALVQMIGRLFYPSLIDAGHARVIAQSAALARVLTPLLALALPLILRSGPITRLMTEVSWVNSLAFAAVVVLYSLSTVGVESADAAYLREAVAPQHRLAIRGLLLSVLAILSLVYVAGGLVIERWNYDGLMLATVGVGLLAILISGLLLEVPPAETRSLSLTGALPTFREQAD